MKPLKLMLFALLLCVVVCFLLFLTWPTQPVVFTAELSAREVAASDMSVTKENSTHDKGDTFSPVRAMQDQDKTNHSKNKNTPTKDKLEENMTPSDSYTSNANVRQHPRYLIYLCDEIRSCGGWGDRQKGIVAAYLLAEVTGRQFGINMSYPCDIKIFYVPNLVDWYVKVKDIRGLNWEMVDWMDNRKGVVDVDIDFNMKYPSDVIFLRTNRDIINRIKKSSRYGRLVPKQFKDGSRAQVFQTIWHILMRKSFHFEEHLDRFMNSIPKNGELVCAHVRIGKKPTISNDGAPINSLSSVDILWRFLSEHDNHSRVFIASDSLDVRNSARKWFGAREIDTDGVVLHIDRQGHKSGACLGLEMALLDQTVLSLCKVLVVSTSNFSIRGAMMSQLEQKLFIFRNGTITPFRL
ncbi:uncharacterized protein LOC124137367 [Haliotis rufescens]|uniref:uncharacterized protein LOC124137367 n=1 Tax=Haliotis rufescens TaxID=6454 RepID=UPI00201F1BDF|nr:uncharacterized protein LOC124137367 [Haliotis rufescens]